jgi:hypothetical protein
MYSGIYFLLGVIVVAVGYCGYLAYQVAKIDLDISDIADYDDDLL